VGVNNSQVSILCEKWPKSFAAFFAGIERFSEGPICLLHLTVVGVASYVAWEPLGVKVKDIRRNLQNTGELLYDCVFRWITPIMLQIVEERGQNLATVFTAKLLGHFLLSQPGFLPRLGNYLTERLHPPESSFCGQCQSIRNSLKR